jgi:hypothetical protein
MIADITCQFTTVAAEIGTEVYGDKGSIQQYFDDGPSTRLPRGCTGLSVCEATGLDALRTFPSQVPRRAHLQPVRSSRRSFAAVTPFAGRGRSNSRRRARCYVSARTGPRVVWDRGCTNITEKDAGGPPPDPQRRADRKNKSSARSRSYLACQCKQPQGRTPF